MTGRTDHDPPSAPVGHSRQRPTDADREQLRRDARDPAMVGASLDDVADRLRAAGTEQWTGDGRALADTAIGARRLRTRLPEHISGMEGRS